MSAATVADYLAALPEDRRSALEAVRRVFRVHAPAGIEEGMQYGAIGYYVPHSIYPAGYHCNPKEPLPFASLASKKDHMAVHLMTVYGSPELTDWFRAAWTATGKKLDMGKACVRFRKLEDLPLEVIAEALRKVPVEEYVRRYESVLSGRKKGSR